MKTSVSRYKNVHNEFQGSYKRVLCVCTGGILRSPTTANILHKKYGYNCRAVGIDSKYAMIPVTDMLLDWADEIVVMDSEMKLDIRHELEQDKPIVNLDIPDMYDFMDKELIEMIEVGYDKYLKETSAFYELDNYNDKD
jgi:predicted protein tyrosine phosphatase